VIGLNGAAASDRKRPRPTLPRWALVVGLMLVFTAAQTYQTWRQPMRGSVDTDIIMLQLIKRVDPTLFPTDPAYGDPTVLSPRMEKPGSSSYPAYEIPVTALYRLIGDPAAAMGLLVPLALFAFILGMWLLLSALGVRWWIALAAALASSYFQTLAVGTWGFQYLNAGMPRSFTHALLPWAVWLCLPWLLPAHSQDRRWWKLALVGLLIGLFANFNGTQSITIAVVLGGLLTLRLARRQIDLKSYGLFILSGLAGAATYAVGFPSQAVQSGGPALPVDFPTFASLVEWRMESQFPFALVDAVPLVDTLHGQIVLIAGVSILSVALYVLALWRTHPVLPLLALLAVQIGMAFLLNAGVYLLLPLGLSLLLFYRADDETFDKFRLFVEWWVICFLAFGLGGMLLHRLWYLTESLSLSVFVVEIPRGLLWIFLSIFVLLALASEQYARRFEGLPAVPLFLVAMWVFLSPLEFSQTWLVAALGALIFFPLVRPHERNQPLLRAIYVAAAATFAARLAFIPLDLEEFSLHAGLIGIACGLGWYAWTWLGDPLNRWASAGIAVTLVAALIGLPGNAPGTYTFPKAVADISSAYRYHWGWQRADWSEDILNLYAAAEWAKESTAADALFYVDNNRFRRVSLRSITHSRTDLGLAFHGRVRFIELYDSYLAFDEAYFDPGRIVDVACARQVDYIVLDRRHDFSLDLPLVFQAGPVRVYAVAP
jgi:hypothetical protein